jgi:hypothetical protein
LAIRNPSVILPGRGASGHQWKSKLPGKTPELSGVMALQQNHVMRHSFMAEGVKPFHGVPVLEDRHTMGAE